MNTASIKKKAPVSAADKAVAAPGVAKPRTPRPEIVQADPVTADNGAMRMVTLRMPENLIRGPKSLAKARRRPYQAMARTFLKERLQAEQASRN